MLRLASLLLLTTPAIISAEVERLPSPAAAESLGPSLVVDASGRVLLSWLQREGSGYALHFSRLEADDFSTPTTIASGEDWFVNWADFPALGTLPSGALLAHWLQKSGSGRYAYNVRVSRSDDGGRQWTTPITPHRDGTQTEHGFVSHFAWSHEVAGFVWLDGRETMAGDGHQHHGHGGAMTLRSAALASDGSLHREALLDARVCDCCQTSAAVAASGPVVVYRGRDADEVRDIMIVRWLGDAWSEPMPVHRDGWVMPACPVNGPQVVAFGHQVSVAWFTMAGTQARVQMAQSNDGGAHFSTPQTLATGNVLGRVGLTQAEDGHLWLAWIDEVDADARLLLAQLDGDLSEQHRIEVARLPRGRISGFPRLVFSRDHGLIIAWTEAPQGRPQVAVARIRAPVAHESSAQACIGVADR